MSGPLCDILHPHPHTVFNLATTHIALRHFAEEHKRCVEEQEPPENVFGIGLPVVTLTTVAAMVAIMILPKLGNKAYGRTLTVFSSLGAGTLIGAIMFIIFPEALLIIVLGSWDYSYKSALIVGGIYVLLLVDRLVKLFFEMQQARHTKADGEGEKPEKRHHSKQNPMAQQALNEHKKVGQVVTEGAVHMVIFSSLFTNLMDGLSMGVAFQSNWMRGVALGFAVVVQQFSQEVADLSLLIELGVSRRKVFLLDLIPAALRYVGFFLGVWLTDSLVFDEKLGGAIMAVTGGMYLYIALASMIPEMTAKINDLLKENQLKEAFVHVILQFIGVMSGLIFIRVMSVLSQNMPMWDPPLNDSDLMALESNTSHSHSHSH